jgi:hypothetical protein
MRRQKISEKRAPWDFGSGDDVSAALSGVSLSFWRSTRAYVQINAKIEQLSR